MLFLIFFFWNGRHTTIRRHRHRRANSSPSPCPPRVDPPWRYRSGTALVAPWEICWVGKLWRGTTTGHRRRATGHSLLTFQVDFFKAFCRSKSEAGKFTMFIIFHNVHSNCVTFLVHFFYVVSIQVTFWSDGWGVHFISKIGLCCPLRPLGMWWTPR